MLRPPRQFRRGRRHRTPNPPRPCRIFRLPRPPRPTFPDRLLRPICLPQPPRRLPMPQHFPVPLQFLMSRPPGTFPTPRLRMLPPGWARCCGPQSGSRFCWAWTPNRRSRRPPKPPLPPLRQPRPREKPEIAKPKENARKIHPPDAGTHPAGPPRARPPLAGPPRVHPFSGTLFPDTPSVDMLTPGIPSPGRPSSGQALSGHTRPASLPAASRRRALFIIWNRTHRTDRITDCPAFICPARARSSRFLWAGPTDVRPLCGPRSARECFSVHLFSRLRIYTKKHGK